MARSYDVFIAFQRDDTAIALSLHEYLNGRGISAFCDAADDPQRELQDSVYTVVSSAAVFLLVATQSARLALQRESSWLSLELMHAVVSGLRVVQVQVGLDRCAELDHPMLQGSARLCLSEAPLTQRSLQAVVSLVLHSPIVMEEELNTSVCLPELRFLLEGVAATAPEGVDLGVEVEAVCAAVGSRLRTVGDLLKIADRQCIPMRRSLLIKAMVAGMIRRVARQEDGKPAATDLRMLWPLIHSALGGRNGLPVRVTKSSQGFFVAPVFFVGDDQGKIRELIRLHYWPFVEDEQAEQERNPFAIHSHQAFGRSWIMAGEIADRTYDVAEAAVLSPTAFYLVRWDGQEGYDLRHRMSTLRNTGRGAAVTLASTARFRAGQSYAIDAGSFHDTMCGVERAFPAATIFYFDAGQGWQDEAPVVGPSTLARAPAAHHRGACDEDAFIDGIEVLVSGRS